MASRVSGRGTPAFKTYLKAVETLLGGKTFR